ncbi:MAG: TIGR02679 family protein [Planctomycetota bacterium]
MVDDAERLRRVLGIPAWDWLRQRLRRHLEAGRPAPARLRLERPTVEERQAANALFATPGADGPITVPLATLVQVLHEAALPTDLREVLSICDGPLLDRVAEQQAYRQRWADLLSEVEQQLPGLREHAPALAEAGTWQRLSAGDLAQCQDWLRDLARLRGCLQRRRDWILQELAAALGGDAHALDRGSAFGRLALLALGENPPADALGWRAAWARQGVRTPETTAPVLLRGLRWRAGVGMAGWNASAAAGSALRLTTAEIDGAIPAVPQRVFICENPSLVEAAARRLPPDAAPLVCIDGQATSAALLLLDACQAAGADLHYHGDFDWPGIAIANTLLNRYPDLRPWRFGAADLQAGAGIAGPPLSGDPVMAAWDPDLATELTSRGHALHEESMLDLLLADLREH